MADGMMVPSVFYTAKITIPDQRALIAFTNGMEQLVIETSFTGAGTNFAWVVPLPSQPVIEEARIELFPRLQYLFRPVIINDIFPYFLLLIPIGLILIILAQIYFYRRLRNTTPPGFALMIVLVVPFVVADLLWKPVGAVIGPYFTPSDAALAGLTPDGKPVLEPLVSVLDRRIVGIFETATIASHDSKALQEWLVGNGYSTPANSQEIIESYVKDGWVFVAAKVRRDLNDTKTSMPHPLSFTCKSDKPVYPMRLTGLNSQSLSVELYVFSHARAIAPHFKIESCTQMNIADAFFVYMPQQIVGNVDQVDLLLLHHWEHTDLAVVTKLNATLSQADMREDIWLDQVPFIEQQKRFFSQQGALTTSANWGTGLLAAGLFSVFVLALFSKLYRSKLPRLIGIVTLASIVFSGLTYLALPKTEVKRGSPDDWRYSGGGWVNFDNDH